MPAKRYKSRGAVFAADDEERPSAEIESKVVAGAGGLANMTDDLPGGGEDPGLFGVEGLRAEIEGCGQRGSASDVVFGGSIARFDMCAPARLI